MKFNTLKNDFFNFFSPKNQRCFPNMQRFQVPLQPAQVQNPAPQHPPVVVAQNPPVVVVQPQVRRPLRDITNIIRN